MVVVTPFNEVGELVQDKVLEALGGLLRKLEVQPDSPRAHAASAPLGLHDPDADLRGPDSQNRLPFGQEGRQQLAQALPIPPGPIVATA